MNYSKKLMIITALLFGLQYGKVHNKPLSAILPIRCHRFTAFMSGMFRRVWML